MDINIIEELNKFNRDFSFRKIQEKYNSPSFLEITSISRSETHHSAFLKWLFKGSDIIASNKYIPLLGLLDILVARDGQRECYVIDPKVKNAIISRSISISNVKARCEQTIGELEAAKKSKDRIDIYIVCDVSGIDGIDQFEIIIENKIGSKEGKLKDYTNVTKGSFEEYYNSRSQTERYVLGTDYKYKTIEGQKFHDDFTQIKKNKWLKNTDKIFQFYVFLTPIASYKLKDYSIVESDESCDSDKFIHINYQDIAEGIIEPILSSENQPQRVRFILEEYMNNLSMPYLDLDTDSNEESKNGLNLILATQSSEKELLRNVWEKFGDLIKMSICIHEDVKIDDMDRQSLFNDAIKGKLEHEDCEKEYDNTFGIGIVVNKEKRTHIKVDKKYICNVSTATSNTKIWPSNKRNYTFEELVKGYACYSDLNLLYNFYENNKSMILAILKILSDGPDANDIRNIYDLLSNTKPKYSVTINGSEIKSEKNKGLSLHEVIICFVEEYAKNGNSDIIDFFNKIRTDFAFKEPQKEFDKKRYDAYELTSNKFKYKCRADKYNGSCDVLYVSNQWGCLTNGKGTFDKFKESLKDYSDFQIKAI